jgi:quinol monooxygenase YgiN
MIEVIVKNKIKEGERDHALALLDELIAGTVKEAGCIRFELYEPADDADTITTFETWEGPEYLPAHFESEYFKRLIPQLETVKRAPDEVEVYTRIR